MTSIDQFIGSVRATDTSVEYAPDDAIEAFFDNTPEYYVDNPHLFAQEFNDAYQGHYKDETDFAREMLDDCDLLDRESLLSSYFDYQRYADDLFTGDYWSAQAVDGTVYVYRAL